MPKGWSTLLRRIPGYDPIATAGDCIFDEKAAQLALDFFPECLRHVKGEKAGEPFVLEILQQSIIANLFGWKRPDGSRRYRVCLILLPRKNGKTTFAAGIALYLLFCDGEPGAEIYSAAGDRDQAALVYQHGVGMVRAEPSLNSRCTIYGGGAAGQAKIIALNDHSGAWKVLSADAKTKGGLNTHGGIIDELYAQPNRDLVDLILTSTGSRRQPLIVQMTTADYDHESICVETEDYAEKVRDGVVDDESFLPVICRATRDDNWRDKRVWKRVNPNLGVSLSMEYLEREFRRACEIPAYENTFKRLHLNIRTEQATRWLTLESWDACNEVVDAEALRGQACWGGLDLATTTDIAAFLLLFPDAGNAVLPFFWVPEENAHQRERRDRVPYIAWAREGLIELTPGKVIDYDVIHERAKALGLIYDIREIAIDRWNSTQLQTQLMGDGFTVVPFGQGFKDMNAPTKELEKLVIAQDVRHGGHPVLRWMASNVAVVTDAAANIKPAKDKSTEKIDGIVALIMALGRAMARETKTGSVYESRGLLTVGGSSDEEEATA